MPEVLTQFVEPVMSKERTFFRAQACGAVTSAGLWEGWIEFIPLDGGTPVRSPRETTQPNRVDTIYWATGLTATYLEGDKSPTCGCCRQWVDHLRQNGFAVRTTDTERIDELKASHRVPRQVQSCHTALVSGYVIEGHVPAADVARLLKERPAIAGIAVPGMPIGSPGMEIPGTKAQPFDVIAFGKDGSTRVFATHGR